MGLRCLLRRLGIFPNAYYNHLKDRKSEYCRNKAKIISGITETYHERKGIPGYRLMAALLKSKGIRISGTTCHKYMNTELGLFSMTRRHKPGYRKGLLTRCSTISSNGSLRLIIRTSSGVPILLTHPCQTAV